MPKRMIYIIIYEREMHIISRILFLIVIVLLLSFCTDASNSNEVDRDSQPKGGAIMPLALGSDWEYYVKEYIDEVNYHRYHEMLFLDILDSSGLDMKYGAFSCLISGYKYFAVEEDGLYLYFYDAGKFTFIEYIKYPVELGETYVDKNGMSVHVESLDTLIQFNDKEYHTLKYVFANSINGDEKTRSCRYYTPGVGLVRSDDFIAGKDLKTGRAIIKPYIKLLRRFYLN